jgi:hypothetical protein
MDRVDTYHLKKEGVALPAEWEIFKDKDGRFRWRLKAANGELVAMAHEGYERKESVIKCIESIRANANAVINDATKEKAKPAK